MRAKLSVLQEASQKPSLSVLSTIWLSLCGLLVYKHPELSAVFFAFCVCWSLAIFLGHAVEKYVFAFQLVQLLYGNVFGSLCTAAGFLAFDHWYSSLYRRKPVSVVLEDAVTLSVMIGMLVVWQSLSNSKAIAYSWSLYKISKLYLSSRAASLKIGPTTATTTTRKCPQKSQDLWFIHGSAYDLEEYIATHPGGGEAILLGRGRDCTALFESYHPFAPHARKVLSKYLVKGGDLPPRDPFYDTLCVKVAQTLREHGLDPIRHRAAGTQRTLYYCGVVAALVLCGYFHCRGSITGSFFLAVFGWLVGSLGHDAGHFAASRWAIVNDVCVWGMSLLCNPIMWQHQHTYAHHSHTNEFDHDPDLHHFSTLLRVHKRFQQSNHYKNQRNTFYVFFAYLFVVFGTCFWIPWGMIKDNTLYGMVEWTDGKRPLRALSMYAHLICYTTIIMALPFFVHNTWWSAVAAVLLHIGTSGLIFAIFSQINHLNEASLTSQSDTESWAATQVATSNNFCPNSALWHVLSNGLNLQIEHHLFPGLNHCHLPIIHPVVQSVCQEYRVPYKSYASWGELMNATLVWLNKLAMEPNDNEFH